MLGFIIIIIIIIIIIVIYSPFPSPPPSTGTAVHPRTWPLFLLPLPLLHFIFTQYFLRYYQQNFSLDFPEFFGFWFFILMPVSYPELYLFFVHVDKLLSLISWFYLENDCNSVFNSTLHNLALHLFVCRHFILTALYTAVVLFSDPVRLTCNNVLSATSMSMCVCIL
jgi:hypothetical protein